MTLIDCAGCFSLTEKDDEPFCEEALKPIANVDVCSEIPEYKVERYF